MDCMDIQRPIDEKSKWIKTNAQFWKFFNKHTITGLEYIGDQMFIRGVPRDESAITKSITKPSYLGSFVLGYSRKIMLNYMKQCNLYFASTPIQSTASNKQIDNDIFYTDTDSLQIHARNIIEQSKELGGITDDLGRGCKILRAFWIAPKLYMLEYIKQGSTKLYYHFKGKGGDSSKLNEILYEQMNEGKSIEMYRDFQMKKIHLNRNSKQQHIDTFSILHCEREKTLRVLNTKKWDGRFCMDSNQSLPHGHDFIPSEESASNIDTEEIGIEAGLVIEDGVLPRKAEPRPPNKYERSKIINQI
jgi:hypothetical protein